MAHSFVEGGALSEAHTDLLLEYTKKVRSTIQSISSQHKDIHSTVCKVGKTIDRVSHLFLTIWSICFMSLSEHGRRLCHV